jgi:hypothetical protein
MRAQFQVGLAAATLFLMSGCGAKVMVPPRIDLKQHETIGIIDFDCSSEGELGPLATSRFTEEIRRDQGLVRILALGSEADALQSIGQTRLDAAAFRALGAKHDLRSIITGDLVISNVRPDIAIAPESGYADIKAEVDASLSVQMIDASTGASIWNGSSTGTERLGNVTLRNGEDLVFDAEDPEKAYGALVKTLVGKVTKDFRMTRERR